MINFVYFGIALVAMILGLHFFIPILKRLNFGQPVYELAPESHQKKQGIPTMGGLSFIIVISLLSLVFLGFRDEHLFVLLGMLLFGMIGFLDDVLKVSAKQNQGLSEQQKILLQVAAAIILTFLVKDRAQSVIIPFINTPWNMGILYYPFAIFFLLALPNSANLTDGVDGLHASVAAIMLVFFALVVWPTVTSPLFGLSIIAIASLIGFLLYNRHPAQLFMGDTGSMAIGGLIGMFFLVTRTPFFAPFVAIIYVAESLSVIIQRVYFKRTKKRFFKMAPIHHHFEQSGYSEAMVVAMFSVVTLIGLVVSLLMYYV